jgi:hypothetical protein
MPIIIQRDATMYSLFISVNCSTYFGWYLHPSSGAHIIAVPIQPRKRQFGGTALLLPDAGVQSQELLMMGGDTTRYM